MDIDESSSPSASPPAAKRQKRMEQPKDEDEQDTQLDGNDVEQDKVRDNGTFQVFTRQSPEVAKYEAYYKAIVPSSEFETFMDFLFKPLPGTFRICGEREDVMQQVKSAVSDLAERVNALVPSSPTNDASQSSTEPYLSRIPWYPDEMGWQVQDVRTILRPNDLPHATLLRNFLIQNTAIGHISRQEAVSMIPPLFMNIKEHHKVLDMCAAPGSKTAQLIEMLHLNAPASYNPTSVFSSHPPGYQSIVRGMVHANDTSSKRCNTLITQTHRLASPSVIITQHDAQRLPTIKTPKYEQDAEESSKIRTPTDLAAGASILYDRILCDVPCSGDGTVRKNIDAWGRWTPTSGHALHPTQLAILRRAIALSAPGARIVYSTCSMNPVEDEAVIAAALQSAEHPFRLVDVSAELPLLRRARGLYSWKCMDNEGQWYEHFEEVPEKWSKRMLPTSFPPDLAKSQELHLERCMRFCPHHQNTGGFFVAVLERYDEVKPNINEDCSAPKEKRQKYKKKSNNANFEFEKLTVASSKEVMAMLKPFYELSDEFPESHLIKHRISNRKLHLTSLQASLLLESQAEMGNKLKVKTLGVRVFESVNGNNTQGTTCTFRLAQCGIEALYPFLGPARVIQITLKSDFELLFSSTASSSAVNDSSSTMQTLSSISSSEKSSSDAKNDPTTVRQTDRYETSPETTSSTSKPSSSGPQPLPDVLFGDFSSEVSNKLSSMAIGSVVFSYFVPRKGLPPHHILLVGWRGKVSVHLLIKSSEVTAVLNAAQVN